MNYTPKHSGDHADSEYIVCAAGHKGAEFIGNTEKLDKQTYRHATLHIRDM